MRETARNDQLWGSEGQSSRSHEAENIFGSLAEASVSSLDPVGPNSFSSLELTR